jgi:hypothetical protein
VVGGVRCNERNVWFDGCNGDNEGAKLSRAYPPQFASGRTPQKDESGKTRTNRHRRARIDTGAHESTPARTNRHRRARIDAVGGLGASGGQKESQKNRFGAAELRPTATSTRPAKTHNRRTTEPYSTPSSALIIPWSCVRITPGLLFVTALITPAVHVRMSRWSPWKRSLMSAAGLETNSTPIA